MNYLAVWVATACGFMTVNSDLKNHYNAFTLMSSTHAVGQFMEYLSLMELPETKIYRVREVSKTSWKQKTTTKYQWALTMQSLDRSPYFPLNSTGSVVNFGERFTLSTSSNALKSYVAMRQSVTKENYPLLYSGYEYMADFQMSLTLRQK